MIWALTRWRRPNSSLLCTDDRHIRADAEAIWKSPVDRSSRDNVEIRSGAKRSLGVYRDHFRDRYSITSSPGGKIQSPYGAARANTSGTSTHFDII